ncbi:glycosyltransferase [bacterium]|jgi:glycosyltransferase involved in cell wall biosynthesis|nr:glycosyltransferase [bacterium]
MNKKVTIILSLFNVEKYLERYFKNVLNQEGVKNIELSIVHNQATSMEKNIIQKYKNKLNITYQEVPLESLYKSWNRAILQSSGEYLVCWNVDDLRECNSIKKMVETLDKNQNIGFTYGDIIIVNSFGKKKGKYVKTPEFTKHLGTTGAIGGPFFMWRRCLIDKIGYFDEQFKSGGDFDYTVRLSIFSRGMKTNGLIGYFLNNGSGLSTKSTELQVLERTAIELRYGIWYKINIDYINRALNYNVNSIVESGKVRLINKEIYKLSESRKIWILFVMYGYFKNNIIKILQNVKGNIFR